MYYEYEKIENLKMEGEVIKDTEFLDCEFIECMIEDCKFERCSFIDCKFTRCNIISVQSKHSQMRTSTFLKCNLIGVHWNELLPAGKISGPIGKLSDCFLKYNTFIEMSLMKFDFAGNNILDSAFENCNLRESSFKGCRLEVTQYTNCDMRKADFRESNGYQIDIGTNRLKDAKFSFPEVINLLNVLGIKID